MSAWWKGLSSKLRGAMIAAAIGVAMAAGSALLPFLVCEETAEAGERPTRTRREAREREARELRERWDRQEREAEEQLQKALDESRRRTEELRAAAPEPRKRQVRRWRWESPAETRGDLWNVPEEESEEALLTALLRVCIAEADGNPQDCAGIWQVIRNNRRRTCDRRMIRRITECDEGGETYLSAIRRHQRHALGMIQARNRRARWISKLTPDCEMPDGYGRSEDHWNAHYGSKVCPQTVADARRLIAGKLPEARPGHRVRWLPERPITWGGRCEANGGACDDHLACARGLVRIKGTNTLNAFWRRSRGPDDVEPICAELGYRTAEASDPEEETPLPAIAGMVSPHEGS